MHLFFERMLEQQLQCLAKKEQNAVYFDIQSIALKSKVNAIHIKATATQALLHNMGFEWFKISDQKKIDSITLDLFWRKQGFKWYIKNINTARNMFDLTHVCQR